MFFINKISWIEEEEMGFWCLSGIFDDKFMVFLGVLFQDSFVLDQNELFKIGTRPVLTNLNSWCLRFEGLLLEVLGAVMFADLGFKIGLLMMIMHFGWKTTRLTPTVISVADFLTNLKH